MHYGFYSFLSPHSEFCGCLRIIQLKTNTQGNPRLAEREREKGGRLQQVWLKAAYKKKKEKVKIIWNITNHPNCFAANEANSGAAWLLDFAFQVRSSTAPIIFGQQSRKRRVRGVWGWKSIFHAVHCVSKKIFIQVNFNCYRNSRRSRDNLGSVRYSLGVAYHMQ